MPSVAGSNVLQYGATKHILYEMSFVVNHRQDRVLPRSLTGAVSASTVMYPVRPFVFLLYADLALVAWRIKQKTLVSLDPGSL